MFVPLEWGSSVFAETLVWFATSCAQEFFNARVILKDPSALNPDGTYILGECRYLHGIDLRWGSKSHFRSSASVPFLNGLGLC